MCAVMRTGIVWLERDERVAFENPDLPFSRIEPVLAVAEQDDTALVLFERLFERQGGCFHLPDDGFQLRNGGFKGLRGGGRFGHGTESGKHEAGKKTAKKFAIVKL